MIRQWRHLKALKRFGRANDATGRVGTQEGDLAVRCPACPYAGINLESRESLSTTSDLVSLTERT